MSEVGSEVVVGGAVVSASVVGVVISVALVALVCVWGERVCIKEGGEGESM